ncbi:MAG TPA: DUF1583 domain-containing protein, partial [Planctomycetaceae bacterium]|nr:DUF1583 domain-containing protein [Planctomycetaceae bacterium]
MSHLLDERLVQSGRKNQHPDPRAQTEQWHPVSRRTAWTQGNGFPKAAWSITPTRARHISSHGDDYLYFHVPLQGDYDIEGDLSTFGYRELHLAVGTIWAGPMYDLKTIEWGTFRENRPALKLDQPFANFGDRMRVRVAVRDGVRTTSVNGRKIFTHRQSPADPWISAHGPWPASGEMENIRISGPREIPSEIDLLAVDDLPGWLPYFGESIGSPQKEWFLEQPQAPGLLQRLFSSGDRSARILRGRKKHLLSGTFHESLLRYHRPMLEDGAIEYEFYYQPGESCVFPALDRLAFLFDSERVGIHWVTDGKFDPSGIDPANFTPVESGTPPSLVAGAWNRLRLSLTGDVVEIAVNGQRIVSRELEPENLRTFGLFFYSDQTESRVRNLRWRGEWPRELPPLERQELADLTLEQTLDRGPELPVVFEHDFFRGLPLDKI